MNTHLDGVGSIQAGFSQTSRLSVLIDAFDYAGAVMAFELCDSSGNVYNNGVANELSFEPDQRLPNKLIISAEVLITVPSNVPVEQGGSKYQVHWVLSPRNGNPFHFYEQLTVYQGELNDNPLPDVIELAGDAFVPLVFSSSVGFASVSVYRGNAKLVASRPARKEGNTFFSEIYQQEYGAPSLTPLSAVWEYTEANARQKNITRETGRVWVITPSILAAISDMQQILNPALLGNSTQPDTQLTQSDYLTFMQHGRDNFNAVITPTTFTFTDAIGALRWYWIRYSCIAACNAQRLAEGLKAFEYSGSSVQLSIDRTSAWETLASSLESSLSDIKPFKDSLARRGVTYGSGNSIELDKAAVGTISIAQHPLTGRSLVRGAYVRGAY